MGAILILGRPDDLCCELVQQQLSRIGQDVWFLSEDQLLPNLRFVWASLDANGVIEYRGRRQRFSDIDGVLCRFYGIPIQPEEYAYAQRPVRQRRMERAADGVAAQAGVSGV